MSTPNETVTVTHDGGSYRWASVTLSTGHVTVKETERTDPHYVYDEAPRRITDEVVAAGTVAAIQVARARAQKVFAALTGGEA